MNSTWRYSVLFAGVVCTMCMEGCGASNTEGPRLSIEQHHDHEPHGDDHVQSQFESLADVSAKVKQFRSSIQEAFAASDMDKADGPVHEVGHLLAEIPKLAENWSLSATEQRQVNQAVDSLMDCFGALDERIHSGGSGGKSFDDVAAQIDAAITELESIGDQEGTQ